VSGERVPAERTMVFDRIVDLLTRHGADFRVMEHEPVRTSEQAARVRGTPLERGAKALVLDTGGDLVMAVISAARRTDFGKLKRHLGSRRVQLASAEAVMDRTGCLPGGVPPFGNLFGLRVLMDPSLRAVDRIDFNAGERARSMDLRREDYERIVRPEVVDFAADL